MSQIAIVQRSPYMPIVSSNIEKQLKSTQIQMDLINESQRIYQKTINCRIYAAKTTSYLCCSCTCIATTVPLILCYPCICYQVLNDKENWFDRFFKYIGCGFDHPPKNRREVYCIFCTPIFLDFPDIRQTYNAKNRDGQIQKYKGADYYAFQEERTDEQLRLEKIDQLSSEIWRLKQLKTDTEAPSLEVMEDIHK